MSRCLSAIGSPALLACYAPVARIRPRVAWAHVIQHACQCVLGGEALAWATGRGQWRSGTTAVGAVRSPLSPAACGSGALRAQRWAGSSWRARATRTLQAHCHAVCVLPCLCSAVVLPPPPAALPLISVPRHRAAKAHRVGHGAALLGAAMTRVADGIAACAKSERERRGGREGGAPCMDQHDRSAAQTTIVQRRRARRRVPEGVIKPGLRHLGNHQRDQVHSLRSSRQKPQLVCTARLTHTAWRALDLDASTARTAHPAPPNSMRTTVQPSAAGGDGRGVARVAGWAGSCGGGGWTAGNAPLWHWHARILRVANLEAVSPSLRPAAIQDRGGSGSRAHRHGKTACNDETSGGPLLAVHLLDRPAAGQLPPSKGAAAALPGRRQRRVRCAARSKHPGSGAAAAANRSTHAARAGPRAAEPSSQARLRTRRASQPSAPS